MAVKRYKGRKSLKQPDEFITFSSRLLKQIILHRTKAIAVLVGIVVVVLAVSGFNYYSKKSEAKAFLLLSQSVSQYDAAKKESTALAAYDAVKNDLEAIAATYGNRMGGKLANFFLADACYAAGDFSRAEALYRRSAKDFKGVVPFEYLALSSLGYSLEQQDKYEESAAVFSEMTSDSSGILGDEALLALSRQYGSMGKTDQQMETAKKLVETYPQSIYTNMLKEKFPGLEQPES